MINRDTRYICMVNKEGGKYLFLVTKDAPEDAIDRIIHNSENRFEFVSGFYLDEVKHKLIIDDFKDAWGRFNNSLQGICYHPNFSEIYEEIKRSSDFIFPSTSFIRAGWMLDLSKTTKYNVLI